MSTRVYPRLIIASISAAMIFLYACSAKMHRPVAPVQEKTALALFQVLQQKNNHLMTVKGLGHLVLTDDATQRLRAAWIGQRPNRLRMELLDVTGLPVISFSNDGDWHYLLDHVRPRFYRKRASRLELKRLISIAVNPGEILDLICGRIPLGNETRSELRMETVGNGHVLIITNQDTKHFDRIHFQDDKLTVSKFERFDKNARLKYQSIFEKMQIVEDYTVPRQMRISNSAGGQLEIKIDRYWVNPNIEPQAFIIKPPASNKGAD